MTKTKGNLGSKIILTQSISLYMHTYMELCANIYFNLI